MGTAFSWLGIAVLHVFISHFAIGGGFFLVVMERAARKAADTERLEFLEKLSRFFVLTTLVMGALTGVGIWFVIGLLNPAATEVLIHNFVWGWAIEWTFFVVEILAALLYYYGWKRMSPADHMTLGWIYFVFAWLSLFVINGILTFMLTPGTWLATGNFWDGFFNPTFWPSLVLRSAIAVMLAGLYALLVASRCKPDDIQSPDGATDSLVGHSGTGGRTSVSVLVLESHPRDDYRGGSRGFADSDASLALLPMVRGRPRSFADPVWIDRSQTPAPFFGDCDYGCGTLLVRLLRMVPRIHQKTLHHMSDICTAMGLKSGIPTPTKGMVIFPRSRTAPVTMAPTSSAMPAGAVTPSRVTTPSSLPSTARIAPSSPQLSRMLISSLRGNMPPFLGTASEANAIAAYLEAHLDRRPLSAIYGLQGIKLGEKVFQIRCGKCHPMGSPQDKTKSLAGLTQEDYQNLLNNAAELRPGDAGFYWRRS